LALQRTLTLGNGVDLEGAKTLSRKFQGLFVGAASSNGWKMIIPQVCNKFSDCPARTITNRVPRYPCR